MYNSIYFRRTGKVFIDPIAETYGIKGEGVPFSTLATVDVNLRSLGYALSNDFAKAMSEGGSERDFNIVMNEVAEEAKSIKGVRDYRPMYPNFPRQVMEAPAAELYWNAILHYAGDLVGWRITPSYQKAARPTLKGQHDVKLIELGSFNDFRDLMVKLASSKSAFSEQDKYDLGSLKGEVFASVIQKVESFDNRENKAWIAAELWARDMFMYAPSFDTATDVLRFAVALSGGDVSLAEKTKFKSFKRSERRMIVSMLNQIKSPGEDMLRHQSAWKALLKNLHIGEYSVSAQLDNSVAAVRGDYKVQTFNGKVERMLADSDPKVIDLLATRPGDFVRRLDKVARTFPYMDLYIVSRLREMASEASTTVLLQAYTHFKYTQPLGVYFPKGQVSKMQIKEKSDKDIASGRSTLMFTLEQALRDKFKALPAMGNVYVSPDLRGIAVPFALRNASQGRVLGRGSRLSLGNDTDVLRFFIWWKDQDNPTGYSGRVDIDLSASAFDENFNHVADIAYHNLREDGAVHSGDFTSAPDGASEFIDIDIERLRGRGVRYVSMIVNSYSGQTFDEVPECSAGFMQRVDLDSGEVYDARTVSERVDLTSKSRGATPIIFDLENREAIWVDLTFKVERGGWNSRTFQDQTEMTLKGLTSLMPPSLYDLFALHAQSRGTLVRSPERADMVFDLESAYDVETILSQYL